jgi:hypothetical protein
MRPGRVRGRAGADRAVTTSANVDLVRSILAAWGRGDYISSEWIHPEIEFVSADGPEPGQPDGARCPGHAFAPLHGRLGGLPLRSGRVPRARR